MAKPQFVGTVRSEYNLSGPAMAAVAKCTSCHNPNKSMNPYGASLKAAMAKAKAKALTPAILKAAAAQDADKDGVANAAELKAGTNPGDPKSK
jgi:predicted CXXCH cytochrome family protein